MSTTTAPRSVKRPAASKTAPTTKTPPRKRTAPKAAAAQTFVDENGRSWTIKRVAEVPDQKFLTGYVHRTIDGLTDFQYLDHALAHKENVRIEGETGTGKTSMVYAYAVYKQMPLYSLSSSAGSDPSQFRGRIIPTTKAGELKWQDGPLTDLMRYGGILLINEINFLPDRVASDLFGALDKRRKIELVDHEGEVIYAPDNFLIVADMNPGYAGTRELNAALANRFAIPLVFDYEPAIEQQLVKMPRLLEVAKKLRDRIAQGDFDTPVSTNMLMEFESHAIHLNLAAATRIFVNHFPQDDRVSVRQVFDINMAELEVDLDALVNPGKSTAKANTVYDDDWEISDEPVGLYAMDELKGFTLPELRDLAVQCNIDPEAIKGMTIRPLKALLTGPVDDLPTISL